MSVERAQDERHLLAVLVPPSAHVRRRERRSAGGSRFTPSDEARASVRGQGGGVKTGRLISGSATTGWADWIHGELWLFPDGLLRVRTGLGATLRNGVVKTVPATLPTRDFADKEIGELANTHGTNRWVAASLMDSASLHRGLTTSRL